MRTALLCLLFFSSALAYDRNDPYSALGLKQGASTQEIKKSYKQLVKEWHPDKNDSPKASERFMEISKAYELLSDPVKKERYDQFGTIDEDHHRDNHFNQFHNFFGFGQFDTKDSFFSKHRIGYRQFHSTINERSNTQPFLIFSFSGYCRTCFALEPLWKSVVEDLQPLGYGIATVNAMTDSGLLEEMRVSRLPTILALVEGRVIHYRGHINQMNAKSIRLFARDVIPNSYLLSINSYDKLKRFIDLAKSTNKVSVLILSSSEEPRLRYLLLAMKMNHLARFAFIYLGDTNSQMEELRHALDIKCTKCENILVFNDFPQSGPTAKLSAPEASKINQESLDELLNKNMFLVLPRISSYSFFHNLCPVSSRSSRFLCVFLVSTSPSDPSIDSFRSFASSSSASSLSSKNIRLSYISASHQSNFLAPFMQFRSKNTKNKQRDLIVLWRSEERRGRAMFMENIWSSLEDDPDRIKSQKDIISTLNDVIDGKIKLENTVVFGSIVDEHVPNVFVRFSKKVMRLVEKAWFELSKEETYPVMSVILTFLFLLVIAFALNWTTKDEKRRRERNMFNSRSPSTDSWHPEDPKSSGEEENLRGNRNESSDGNEERRQKRALCVMQPLLHELRAESYFGMIRLLKPGCRSLIVLVDEETKDQLLPKFSLAVYPLRNNKTFSFGYLMVDKNLRWFRTLLEQTLPREPKDEGPSMYSRLKGINVKQTIGTVLVLCGWKLYFCIYHPMHAPSSNKHFLGFDGDSDEDFSEEDTNKKTERERPNVSNVLNGFPNWLDRLLEGSVSRYYIPEWPDNLH